MPQASPDAAASPADGRRIEAVVNAASGGVDAGAAEALEAMLTARGLAFNLAAPAPNEIELALRKAVEAKPDLLIVLAGDGTARLACELAGPEGPVVMALPGGTMNMLPFALYGRKPWREALTEALDRGVERPVSAGEVDGQRFFVAAILGDAALFGPAREALRKGKLRLAWLRLLRAMRRAFRGRLRFRLDAAPERKADALSLICPLVSRALHEDVALDVAALSPRGPGDAIRLGARTLLADVLGDWRDDPSVHASRAREIRVRNRGRIPALLDGESHRLPAEATVRFRPAACRALALPEVDGAQAATPERRSEEAGTAIGAGVAQAAAGG